MSLLERKAILGTYFLGASANGKVNLDDLIRRISTLFDGDNDYGPFSFGKKPLPENCKDILASEEPLIFDIIESATRSSLSSIEKIRLFEMLFSDARAGSVIWEKALESAISHSKDVKLDENPLILDGGLFYACTHGYFVHGPRAAELLSQAIKILRVHTDGCLPWQALFREDIAIKPKINFDSNLIERYDDIETIQKNPDLFKVFMEVLDLAWNNLDREDVYVDCKIETLFHYYALSIDKYSTRAQEAFDRMLAYMKQGLKLESILLKDYDRPVFMGFDMLNVIPHDHPRKKEYIEVMFENFLNGYGEKDPEPWFSIGSLIVFLFHAQNAGMDEFSDKIRNMLKEGICTGEYDLYFKRSSGESEQEKFVYFDQSNYFSLHPSAIRLIEELTAQEFPVPEELSP